MQIAYQPIDGRSASVLEAACLRLSRHHRAERPTLGHARHAGSHQLRRRAPTLRRRRRLLAERGRLCLFAFFLGRIGGQPLHLLHQPLHPTRLQKRRGRFGLRVALLHFTRQSHPTDDLVLLVVLLI